MASNQRTTVILMGLPQINRLLLCIQLITNTFIIFENILRISKKISEHRVFLTLKTLTLYNFPFVLTV